MSSLEVKDTNLKNVPKEELRHLLQQKAKDLFLLCDKEEKGFTTKRDMHRLQEEVPLTPEQLDEVFDVLDKDKNGYLTLEEFTEGFGMFLGIETQSSMKTPEITENLNRPLSFAKEIAKEEEDEAFEDFLDELGAHNLFKDEDYIRLMWQQVKNEDPAMLHNFEDFLGKITYELKKTKNEYSTLESTLKNRSDAHNQQVHRLHTEMEEQLKIEKEQLLHQEKLKEKRIRDELEEELQLKDQQLQELLTQHSQLEKQLDGLNAVDIETKHENIKLQKERDVLERQLMASEEKLNNMKAHLELLRKKSLEEKRKRAKAVFKASEGIALEREDLVKELNHLKTLNKQLLDKKDEVSTSTPITSDEEVSFSSSAVVGSISPNMSMNLATVRKKVRLLHGTEVLAHPLSDSVYSPDLNLSPIKSVGYSDDGNVEELRTSSTPILNPKSLRLDEECEVDDSFFENNPQFVGLKTEELKVLQNNLNFSPSDEKNIQQHMRSSKEIVDKSMGQSVSIHSFENRSIKHQDNLSKSSCHQQNEVNRQNNVVAKKTSEERNPERLFKIVFIGDSGVGKTCFLHRFCNDTFRSTFSATIGVDFQVKTINVDGHAIALQLWDTAGQERFRSMTKQYYRKADGIIIVYDVTTESSFKSVRNWIYQVKDGSDDNTVIMLIGNKIDLCDGDEHRVVKTKDGCRIADEFGTLLFETSAKTGTSVFESIAALSSVLLEKEDERMEKVVQLQEEEMKRKKKCC